MEFILTCPNGKQLEFRAQDRAQDGVQDGAQDEKDSNN